MVNAFHIGVILVLVFAIFLFVKLKYIKHKITWIVVLFLMLIFYLGFLASISGQELDLNTLQGSETAIKLYFGWMGQSFDNVKSLTGQATKLDWGTNATEIKARITPVG